MQNMVNCIVATQVRAWEPELSEYIGLSSLIKTTCTTMSCRSAIPEMI